MQELAWWQSAIIYEIYPRSFQDSNAETWMAFSSGWIIWCNLESMQFGSHLSIHRQWQISVTI
jgi:hypothetical protein